VANRSSLVIGLDSSTSSCKAIVWDCRGNAIGRGTSPLTMTTPQPTWHEQSAESWWTAAVQAIRQATEHVDGEQLKALCIAHQRETFVPVDGQGRPLSNGILWMDERASGLLPDLEKSFGQHDFHRQTGKRLSVNLTIAKMAWLKKYQPEIFIHTHKYLDVHSFLVHRLTGSYSTGWGCADPTGLYDMLKNRWAKTLLSRIGIRLDQLPDVVPTGKVIGTVIPYAAEACGLPVHLPVVAGIGDGQASGLGVNITGSGESYLSLGTSVISGIYSEQYVIDPAFRTMSGGIPGSYLLETVLLGGGYTISWFMEKMAGQPGQDIAPLWDTYERAASKVPPGSEGLMAVPYWNSVLGPYWDPAASGITLGWRGMHQRPHLYRAILEGIAYEQRLLTMGVEKALGQSVKRYVAMGSGALSPLWCQIIADITGKPVFRSTTTDAAALGAGILAAAAAGIHTDVRQAAQAMTRIHPQPFEPDPSRHDFYSRLFDEVYRPLFPALQPYLDRLASLSNEPAGDNEPNTTSGN